MEFSTIANADVNVENAMKDKLRNSYTFVTVKWYSSYE